MVPTFYCPGNYSCAPYWTISDKACIIGRCSYTLDPDGGEPLPLIETVKTRLTQVQELWASKGQRVLLLARKVVRRAELPLKLSFDSQDFADHINLNINHDLTIVGLVGLVDPPKDDIPATVATLRSAYIRVSQRGIVYCRKVR